MRKVIGYTFLAIVIIVIGITIGSPEIGLGIVATASGVWFYNAVKDLEEEEQL